MTESPVDRAWHLFASGEPAEALRWSVAALERDPCAADALFVTSRALARLGGSRAAIDGLRQAACRAAASLDAPLAIAAIAELRALGADIRTVTDEVAHALCLEASAGLPGPASLPVAQAPLVALSAGIGHRALLSRAAQMIYEAAGADRAASAPLAFLGTLSHAAVRDLILAYETATVGGGHVLLEEGEVGECSFVLVSGGADISRRGPGGPRPLAQVQRGGLFGELALLGRLPAPATITCTQASVVLVAWRDAIEAVGARHPELRLELTAYARQHAAVNLGSALGALDVVPLPERAELVERMELRTFAKGDRIASSGEEADGIHLVVSGEVVLVARDAEERVVLETLAPGDTVGEAALVLCRRANTEAVAVDSAATLFLPRDAFVALVDDCPTVLRVLHGVASRRDAETRGALGAHAASVGDDCELRESADPPEPPTEEGAPHHPGAPPPLQRDALPPPSHREPAPAPWARETAPGIGSPPVISTEPPRSARVAVGMAAPKGAASTLAPAALSQPPRGPSRPAQASPLSRAKPAIGVVGIAAILAALVGTRETARTPVSAGAGERAESMAAPPPPPPEATMTLAPTGPSLDRPAPAAVDAMPDRAFVPSPPSPPPPPSRPKALASAPGPKLKTVEPVASSSAPARTAPAVAPSAPSRDEIGFGGRE